ncbi:MAG: hypothetical protein EBT09_13415 [Actinobacteria bacterium]|nr:hypothetical protein [Actinomycetota bacterium]
MAELRGLRRNVRPVDRHGQISEGGGGRSRLVGGGRPRSPCGYRHGDNASTRHGVSLPGHCGRCAGDCPLLGCESKGQATVFVPSPGRGGRVIRELTRAVSHGVVTSDREAGSDCPDPASLTLVCWALPARNAGGLVPRDGDGNSTGVWARSLSRSLFAGRSAFVENRMSVRTYQRRMQSGSGELLTQGSGSADLRVRRMCKGSDHLWPALRPSQDVPRGEPTNNVSERAIRPAILWRKGSSGTQSGSGARFAGAMLTVAATCRMHGLDLFACLAGVCTASMADLAVPQLLPAPA